LKSARLIPEGAVTLAIYSILLLLFTYIPIMSLVLLFFIPLPFIRFSFKFPLKESIVITCLGMGLTLIMTSVTMIPVTLMFSTLGILIGYSLKKERSKGEILLSSTFLVLIHIVLLNILAKVYFQTDLANKITTMLIDSIDNTKKMYSDIGISYDEKSLDSLTKTFKLIPVIFPTLLLMASFVYAFLTQAITFPIIKRLGVKTPKFKPFREFRIPVGFSWFFLVVLIFNFFRLAENSYLYIAVINLTYVLQLLLIVQGFASIFYFSYLKKLTKAVPILILIVCIFIQPLIYIVLLIGIVSIGIFNRRKK